LIPYARNARTHTDEQVAQVAASIIEFGWTNPILVGADCVVIAGHARLAAARRLRMDEVPSSCWITSRKRRGAAHSRGQPPGHERWMGRDMLRVDSNR